MICFFDLVFITTLLVTFSNAYPIGLYCNKNTIIPDKTNINSNIDILLTQLVSKTTSTNYTATTYGTDLDKVYGLAQCRADVSEENCSNCIQDAAKQIRQRCPNTVDTRIWYDHCFLRYHNEAFAGNVDTSHGSVSKNNDNVTEPESFKRELRILMMRITYQTFKNTNNGLGKSWTILSTNSTLYGLVQCTRDLTSQGCAQCIDSAQGLFPKYCGDRKGCRVMYSSCYVRYELYPFFFPLEAH